MARGIQRREVMRVFHHDLFASLGTGKTVESSLLQTWDQTRGFGGEKESEVLKLTYLLSWLSCFFWQACLVGSQGMPAGVGGLEEDNGMKEGEEGWRKRSGLCDSWRWGQGGREGAQMFCCRAGDKIGDWIWRRGGRKR